MTEKEALQQRAINTIRFLSADAVQRANSGHPGLPMGAAAVGYTLWTRYLKHNPGNPAWDDRDRFVLSGGHGSMLLYSLLHLTGYDLPLEEIKNFRQWGSITPGHPEYGLTPGVETTTGPLGQGFGNGVGFAIAEAHLAAKFNQPDHKIVDHYTYGLVTDGDLMEGVSSEAASLAGHLQLGKLIYFYDDNHISIDGDTALAFSEDSGTRFESYGWQVLRVEDGNDVEAIDQAIQQAQGDPRPSLIMCRTKIGYGMPNKQGTKEAHGEPPGEEELEAAKERLGWPQEPRFYIPDDVLEFYRQAEERGQKFQAEWEEKFERYQEEYPELAEEYLRRQAGDLPENWVSALPEFSADEKGMATRAASGQVINALTDVIPELLGGSADLTPSNKTWIDGSESFQKDQYQGRNFHFGVREHAMGAIVNGLAIHGGLIPYAGTFLVFSDYMRPAVRLSALSEISPIWIYTHDSIGLGEDGPTHQPVEHLAAMRAIPHLHLIRPNDANEVAYAWKAALEYRGGPTALVLTRQNVGVIDREVYASAENLGRGAYVLADIGDDPPEVILMASGSEVELIVKAGERLGAEGVNVRLVSFPSWELFKAQNQAYRDQVLPPDLKVRVAVETGISQGWERWLGEQGLFIGVERFGASAPGGRIYEEYGLTVEDVIIKTQQLLLEVK